MKAVVGWVQTHHAAARDESDDWAILSFSLLLAVLVAGVVLSLTHAEANQSLFTFLN